MSQRKGQRPLNTTDLQVLSTTPDGKLLEVFPKAQYGLTRRELRELKKTIPSPERQAREDVKLHQSKESEKDIKRRYKALVAEHARLQEELGVVLQMADGPMESEIPITASEGESEATAIIVWSDWHIEESVHPEEVNGLNTHNLDVSQYRVYSVFDNTVKLLRTSRTPITRIVLALLGDFINGSIHDELMESNLLLPADAILRAQNLLVSGIRTILMHTECEIVVHCHSGNHGRMTQKQRKSTEHGNSLEA